jgi:hypothetical protein
VAPLHIPNPNFTFTTFSQKQIIPGIEWVRSGNSECLVGGMTLSGHNVCMGDFFGVTEMNDN